MTRLQHFSLLLFLVGMLVGWTTYQENELASRQSSGATTLKELVTRGRPDGPHLILKDFAVVAESIVLEPQAQYAVAPILTLEQAAARRAGGPQPTQLEAVIYVINVKNHHEVMERLNRPSLPGVLATRTSIPEGVRKLLQERYPQTDFDRCLIFDEGRELWSETKLRIYAAGSTVGVAVGLAGLWTCWRRRTR